METMEETLNEMKNLQENIKQNQWIETTTPHVSDSSFIFDKLKELLDKQECNIIEYMNECMSQDERYQHGENIWRFLENADGLIARIKIDMLVDGRCVD